MTNLGVMKMQLGIVKKVEKYKKYIKRLQDKVYILTLENKRLITENKKLIQIINKRFDQSNER